MGIKWPWQKTVQKIDQEKESIPDAMRRAYAAAAYNHQVSSWMATSASADAVMRGPLKVLRNRARDLARNNDYIKQFLREVQNNVVGTNGIPFQAQVRKQRGGELDEKINDAIEEEFLYWSRKEFCHTAGELSFTDIERLLIREVAECGEVFVRKIRRPFGDGKIPLSLEIIEADRVDDDMNGFSALGNEIVMGVEKDAWGRRVAYYIKPKHPGDNSPSRVNASNSRQNIRIPADEIIHLGLIERWPQTRSVPWFVSSIMRLHHMGGYEEAEVIGARATASLMGFIESDEGEIRGDGVEGGERISDFQPGTFKYLGKGEKINIPNISRPAGQLDPFMSFMLRGVAAGCGVSYEGISKDYSKSTYSSSRQSLLSERDSWRALQGWMIRNFHQAILEEFLTMATLAGVLNLPGYETSPRRFQAVKWMPRGWAWIDPSKEVAAYKEAIRGGLKTQTDVLAEEGKDFEDMVLTRAREMKFAAKHKVVFDTDAAVDRYGRNDPKAGSGDNPPDEEDDEKPPKPKK